MESSIRHERIRWQKIKKEMEDAKYLAERVRCKGNDDIKGWDEARTAELKKLGVRIPRR